MDIYNLTAGLNLPTAYTNPDGTVGYSTAGSPGATGTSGSTSLMVTDFAGVPGKGEYSTIATVKIIDGLAEGPIEGWPTSDPYKHIYIDGIPIKSLVEGNLNITNVKPEYKWGTANQTPLTNYTSIGAAKTPTWSSEIIAVDSTYRSNGKPILQTVQIRDDSTGSYPPVEAIGLTFSQPEGQWYTHSDGDLGSCIVTLKIEINNKADGTGQWVTRLDETTKLKVQNAFEKTYVIKLPPGWLNAKSKQEYDESALVDDVILIRITKTGGEGNTRYRSTLYLKNYTIYSYNRFNYPYTAVAGITIDSGNFDGRVPRRQYELLLKKIKVPSNYTITRNAKGDVTRRQYTGVWDGTFKTEWSDNAAWCFYDLVTNPIYGLGKYIDASLLNKWALYSIGKYCDAVDSSGVFDINAKRGGVPNGYGGIEPRYTCNLYLNTQGEAYDRIMQMASIFKGIVFFQNNAIHTTVDKESTVISIFTNSEVAGGTFNYSTSGIKARHTVAKVKWFDPEEYYTEKIEYVEDPDGIRRFGYREIEIEAFGSTSRGQARRAGRHTLITEKFESEIVAFTTGLKGAVLSPGMLIKIKDNFRELEQSGGRIKEIVSATKFEIDRQVKIPAGATNIKLWVEAPNALVEDNVPLRTLKPTTSSYSITAGAGATVTEFTSASGNFPTNLSIGNSWILSYMPAADRENTSVYKIVSVVERAKGEYEIQALQHYAAKYTDIENLIPIKSLPPPSFSNIYPDPPEFGRVTFDIRIYKDEPVADIQIFWSKAATAVRYNVLHSIDGINWNTLLANTTNTSHTWPGAPLGLRYFKILSVTATGRISYQGLILGPYDIKLAPPVIPSVPIPPLPNAPTHTDPGPGTVEPGRPTIEIYDSKVEFTLPKPEDRKLEYEVWKNTSGTLRTLVLEDALILGTSQIDNAIKVEDSSLVLGGAQDPGVYRVEQEITPYQYYRATTGTNENTVVIVSLSAPTVRVGDVLFNCTRNTSALVYDVVTEGHAVSYFKATAYLASDITGQAEGDVFYSYAGIMGVAAVRSKTPQAETLRGIRCASGTDSTTIVLQFSAEENVESYPVYGISSDDYVYNAHRGVTVKVASVAGPTIDNGTATYILTVPTVAGQAENNLIYSTAFRGMSAPLYKYTAGIATTESILEINSIKTSQEVPSIYDIVVNTTLQKATSIDGIYPKGATPSVAVFPALAGQASGDVFFILKPNTLYKADTAEGIHPEMYTALVGSDRTHVSATNAFAEVAEGDLIYCLDAQKYAIIQTKTDDSSITLLEPGITSFTSGKTFFVQKCSDMFVGGGAPVHPPIFSAASGTLGTNIYSTTLDLSTYGVGDVLVSMKNGDVAEIVSTESSEEIWIQNDLEIVEGDRLFIVRKDKAPPITPTSISAMDGAFALARPGDAIHNLTLGKTSRIIEVTRSGIDDPTYDEVRLETPIFGQSIGDQFLIVKGYYSWTPTGFFLDDTIRLKDSTGAMPGTRVDVYKMAASLVGKSIVDLFVDPGLEQGGFYWYWTRAVDYLRGYLVSDWLLKARGKEAERIPLLETCYDFPMFKVEGPKEWWIDEYDGNTYENDGTTEVLPPYTGVGAGEIYLQLGTDSRQAAVQFSISSLFPIDNNGDYVESARRYIVVHNKGKWREKPYSSIFTLPDWQGYLEDIEIFDPVVDTLDPEFLGAVLDTGWVYTSTDFWESVYLDEYFKGDLDEDLRPEAKLLSTVLPTLSQPLVFYVDKYLGKEYQGVYIFEYAILKDTDDYITERVCIQEIPDTVEESPETTIGTKPPSGESISTRGYMGRPYEKLVSMSKNMSFGSED
jgi:predicted phage tail protein